MIYFIITLVLIISMFVYFKHRIDDKQIVDINYPTTNIPEFSYKGNSEFNTKVLALLDTIISEDWGYYIKENITSSNSSIIFYKENVDLYNIPKNFDNLYLILSFRIEKDNNKFTISYSNYGNIFEFGDDIRNGVSNFRINSNSNRFTFEYKDADKIVLERLTTITHHIIYNDMVSKYEKLKRDKLDKISNLDKALISYNRDKKIDDLLK